MRRYQLFLIGVVFAANGLVVEACSSDDTLTDAGGDAADGGKDVSHPDVAPDVPQPPVTPAGKELVPSDGVQIFGITTDGLVIYADSSQSNALFAVDTAGASAPVKIAAPSAYAVGIAGKVVFVWSSLTAKQVGALSTWTAGGTYTPVSAKSAPNGGFSASADGKYILFTANADTNGVVGDFVGANANGTGQSTLLTGVDIDSAGGCRPLVGFPNATTIAIANCASNPPDGGTPVADLNTFSASGGGGDAGATWTKNVITTGALDFWSTDTVGDKILAATPAGLTVYPITGGAGTAIDTKNIENGNWTFGYLNKAGTDVVYSTAAGALYTAATTTPTPATLQATGVNFVRAISGDDKYVMYTKTFDSQQFGGDLYLSKATDPAGTAATLVGTTTGALFPSKNGDEFTTDNTYALFIENLNSSMGLGDLFGVPVTGGSPKQFATGEWQNTSATGTKVVFNDNCGGCSGTAGTGVAFADIKVIDVATTNAAVLLQAGADVPLQAGGNSLWLNVAKDHVIYTYSQNTASSGTPAAGGNGMYSVAIP